ncbi:hypothetical protein WN944_023763 [Citrus x changshan-huyou]|uniref:Flavanone 7-O-glucoside 2''-O-beta-L-rhamnosyltransferase n=3 Tax=Citrus TaxID=2706 RepID=FLRT_CITMA|nr:RecName: Full=Flavanone 7-O-glucoside 2''-O-beta-L-rhamnosyltransferase; AltName: Full=1,2 rhamnosyltransferase [Citrus maxima]AAL06646.2 flavonoid 1-2 rhamnosyltransferase [Citrus maxima]WMD01290.1 flavonoid 1-2 rhamnosyltransferase [Citrus maxima]
MDTKHQDKPSILMLPWLAHGHIAPHLELAKKLSQKNFHIYFCSTPNNLQSFGRNVEKNFSSSIQLIELQLPNTFPELPSQNQTTKNLPPHLIYTLVGAFEDAKPAFCNILETLKPTLVMYDLFQPWAAEAAYQYDIAAILFLPLSAVACSFLLHNIVNPSLKYPFFESDYQDRESKNINYFLHLTANGTLNKDRFLKAFELSCKFVFIKTSREIESKYLDYFPSLMGNEIIPVGPLIQEPTFKEDDTKIMDWLSQKEPRSVVYASFGSEYFPSKDEIHEIASGLLLSEVNFIWAFRLHPDEKMTIEEALPQGFAEEIERNNKGMIVQGWVPQAKILRHGSIGGFLSHCGWGSVVEGMVFGVPIIGVPMAYEQPSNAKVVVDNGMGMVVPRDKINQRLGGEEVARVIKHVVLQEEAKQIRRKANEISESMKKIGDAEMSVVVEKLLQLVKKSE